MSARKAAEEAGRSGSQAAKASSLTGMNLSEAKQILNLQDLDNMDVIKKVTWTYCNLTWLHSCASLIARTMSTCLK